MWWNLTPKKGATCHLQIGIFLELFKNIYFHEIRGTEFEM